MCRCAIAVIAQRKTNPQNHPTPRCTPHRGPRALGEHGNCNNGYESIPGVAYFRINEGTSPLLCHRVAGRRTSVEWPLNYDSPQRLKFKRCCTFVRMRPNTVSCGELCTSALRASYGVSRFLGNGLDKPPPSSTMGIG